MPIAIVLFCCAVSFYIFSLLSLNHSLLDSDLYYHLAVARLYSSQEQLTTLPWAKESIWSMGFGDTHLLFHQLLRLANSIGIKQFIALFIGINLFAFLKVNKPKTISEQLGMVLLFLFGSYIFTGRLLFAKGLIVFLPILFLYIYYWKEKNIKIIFGLSFIAVWTYPLAPILLVYSTIDSILQKWFHKEKFPIKELIISYSAFMIGILIHPSFPHQFKMFYWEWFGQIFPPPNIEPIAEWMAPEFNLFVKSFIALILLGIFFYKKSDISLAIVFLLGVVSSYFTTKSIEWSVPFGLMWIASSAEFRTFLNSKYSRITIIPILLLGSSLLGLGVQSQLKKQSNSFKREHASFLCRELPTEIKIWIRWDDFQEFVYECPNRVYPFGLNPLYAYIKDPIRYEMIRSFWFDSSIDNSDVPPYMGYEAILIFPDRDGKNLVSQINGNPNWNLAYNFPNALVFLYNKNIESNQNRKVKIIPKNFILPSNEGK